MSIRDEIREENRKNFKEMPFSKKVKHFWHYYKVHVLVITALLAFAIYFILLQTVLAPKPIGFTVYALESNYYLAEDVTPIDAFIMEFATSEGIDTEEYQVFMDASNNVDPSSTNMLDMAIDMKLVTAGQEGDLDVLIGTQEQIDFYVINGFYSPTLDELFSEELFSELDEKGLIYYYYDEESDKEYPIGVYVKDAPRLAELGLYEEDKEVILAIVGLSERTDTSVRFVEYIFETP